MLATKRPITHLMPVIVGITGALTAALLLFPPWNETVDIPYRMHTLRALGYSSIWSPPSPSSIRASIAIDWDRLRLEVFALWALVAAISLAIWYHNKIRRRDNETQSSSEPPRENVESVPQPDSKSASMNSEIARHISPREQELAGKRQELAILQAELTDRELSLASLRGELADRGRGHLCDKKEEAEEWLRKGLELQKAAPEELKPELRMTLEYVKHILAGTQPDVAAKNLGMTPDQQERAHVAHYFMPDTLKGCAQLEEARNNQLMEAFRCFECGIHIDPHHPLLQRQIGTAYHFGLGVMQDYSQAFDWFRKAAEQGDAEAQYCLGCAYSNGDGVAEDEDLSLKWLRKAAEQGNADAQGALDFDARQKESRI